MSQLVPSFDPLLLSFQSALAGRYSIDRELGRGGMGVVYLATEVHLDRLVAIKLLPPERSTDPTLRERFIREARLAAKLSHPNIIPIHAVEETGQFVFYVMAFVNGETLADRVRTRGPLSASEGARVLREVAWALAYAHSQGLVHRDVKPDNILLESSSGRVLVADFGIAAAAGVTGPDGISGTPEFMSPEQALGGEVDARSDLYGLGATAFFAFSGRFPFEGESATEILAKQVTEPAPPLGSLGMAVPRKLALLVDRCLAKKPDQRPASAQALAEQLSVALEQRREQPAALRSFVKRAGRLDGGGTLVAGFGVVSATMIATALYGAGSGSTTFALGATLLPFGYFVAAARRLTLLGFAHDDLATAFKVESDKAREELAVERGLGPTTLDRWLPIVATTSGAVTAVLVAASVLESASPLMRSLFGSSGGLILGLAGTIAVLSTANLLTRRERQRDAATEFWGKVWVGKIGKMAFSVAQTLVGNAPVGSTATHRATELSIGMAADQLYERLPKRTRRQLGDVPILLRRLQADAQRIRAQYSELQEALEDAGDAAVTIRYADVCAARDAAHEKLSEAVGALETIRLNLLRLHAGSATVEGLTTHLRLAADVSADIERLIAANREIDASLEFPRETATTPV